MKKIFVFLLFSQFLYNINPRDSLFFKTQQKINEEVSRVYKSGDYKKSIELCLKFLNNYPENEYSLMHLAYSYQHLKNYKKAENIYLDVIKMYPKNNLAKYNLSNVYNVQINEAVREQNFNLAYSIIKKAEYHLPENPYFYMKDAELNFEDENYEEACKLIKTSWEKDPRELEEKIETDLWKLHKLGACYKRMDRSFVPEWKKFVSGLLKKSPNNNELMILLANIYFYNNEELIKRNNLRNKAMNNYLSRVGERLPVEVGFPLKGRWIIVSGFFQYLLDTHNGYDGYCLDFSKIDDKKNRLWKGNGKNNDDYLSYGEKVYSAYDGVVEYASDKTEDNTVGEVNFNSTNSITIRHNIDGKTIYTVYIHLKKDSLKVKTGDTVKKGDEIGLIGNSGISYAPHLHFGVYDENKISLPFKFTLDNPDNTLTLIEPKKEMVIIN